MVENLFMFFQKSQELLSQKAEICVVASSGGVCSNHNPPSYGWPKLGGGQVSIFFTYKDMEKAKRLACLNASLASI